VIVVLFTLVVGAIGLQLLEVHCCPYIDQVRVGILWVCLRFLRCALQIHFWILAAQPRWFDDVSDSMIPLSLDLNPAFTPSSFEPYTIVRFLCSLCRVLPAVIVNIGCRTRGEDRDHEE